MKIGAAAALSFLAVLTLAYAALNHPSVSGWLLSRSISDRFQLKDLSYERISGGILGGLAVDGIRLVLEDGTAVRVAEFRLEGILERGLPPKLAYHGGHVEADRYGVSIGSFHGDTEKADLGPIEIRLDGLGSAAARSGVWKTSGELTLNDVRAQSPLHPRAALEIQLLRLKIGPPIEVLDIINGRFRAGTSDPIVFYGSMTGGSLDIRIYAKEFELKDIVPVFAASGIPFSSMTGSFSETELSVTGSPSEPRLSGRSSIRNFRYRQFSLTHSSWRTDGLTFDLGGKEPQVAGTLFVESGTLARGSAVMTVLPGTFHFDGDPEEPIMDLSGVSNVADTRIHLGLRGVPIRPDLRLTSDPPYSEEKLAIMLLTGREWKGSEKAMRDGELSLDAAQEFFDYFLMGGSGHRFAARFGVKEFSIGAKEGGGNVRVKKALSDKVDVGYGIEKDRQQSLASSAQAVGMDYNMSRDTTVSLEGKIGKKASSESRSGNEEEVSRKDQSVLMKVNRRF